MSEWSKEHAWKACVRVSVPRVRIPLSPPPKLIKKCYDAAVCGCFFLLKIGLTPKLTLKRFLGMFGNKKA